MAAFLEKNKVQRAGRVSLGPAALRNLKLSEGDFVEIYYDEGTEVLIIKRLAEGDSPAAAKPKKIRSKK